MRAEFEQAISAAARQEDPQGIIEPVKQAVAREIRFADPAVAVTFTDYFNHTIVPDMVLRWSGQHRERLLYIRPDPSAEWLAHGLRHMAMHKPVVFTLEDLRPGGTPQDPGDRARLAGIARDAGTWITGPSGIAELARARDGQPGLLWLVRALVRGGRGVTGPPEASSLAALVAAGFLSPASPPATAERQAMDALRDALSAEQAAYVASMLSMTAENREFRARRDPGSTHAVFPGNLKPAGEKRRLPAPPGKAADAGKTASPEPGILRRPKDPRQGTMYPLVPGDPLRIAGYTLEARLSSGFMGPVYLGRSRAGRPAAVKVIGRSADKPSGFRDRLSRRIADAAKVSSPYVVPVLDADLNAAPPWLATAYVPGPALLRLIEGDGPLSGPEIRLLASGLVEGLTAIHSCGLVHGSLSPGKILLTDAERWAVRLGFGPEAPFTQGLAGGRARLGYMSPEQLAGPALEEGDVYALGAVLAFAVTGYHPIAEGSAGKAQGRVSRGMPGLFASDGALSAVIRACMDPSPARRPSLIEISKILGSR